MPLPRIPHTGLTLVELLLTITLFAMILLSVAGLVRSGLQVQNRVGRQVVPYQQMERALTRLERDVESAQRLFAVPVVGADDAFELARVDETPTADGVARDWVRVRYRVESADGETHLVREQWTWRVGGADGEPMRRETLLTLAEGHFTFGMLGADQHLAWVEAWDGQQHGVPRLVRFDGTLPVTMTAAAMPISRVMRNPAGALPQQQTP